MRSVPRENASDTPARYATQMRYFSSLTHQRLSRLAVRRSHHSLQVRA